jgi:hypothetical protein
MWVTLKQLPHLPAVTRPPRVGVRFGILILAQAAIFLFLVKQPTVVTTPISYVGTGIQGNLANNYVMKTTCPSN